MLSLLTLMAFTGGASAQEELTVETWNVGLAYGFVENAEGRKAPILEALAGSESDLICLQEVWEPEDKADIAQAVSGDYGYAFYTEVEQTKADRSPACRIRDLFGEGRFVSCMTGSCGGLDGDALTDCIVNECGPILEELKADKPDCATSLMAQVGKPAPKALWTVIRPIRKAGIYAYNGSDGLMMLSREPLLDSGTLDFSDIATLNRRRALYGTVDVGGEPTRVYCTHLSANLDEAAPYPGPFDSWSAENRAQTERLLAHAGDFEGAAALTGDFNCSFDGELYDAEAEASCALVVETGYADPASEDGSGCTYCDANSLTAGDGGDRLLDHIFVRGLAGDDGAVGRDELVTLADGVESNLSDHYGYALRLSPDPLLPLVAAGACAASEESPQSLTRYELAEGLALLEVTCATYPYQVSLEYWLQGEGGLTGAGEEGTALAFAGIPTFDPARATLEVLAKGRGAGDCGVWTRHALAGDAFVLEERRERSCDEEPGDGDELPPPQEWPLTFPEE